MKTLTTAELQRLIRQAKTLEQSHELTILLVQALKAKYQGTTYHCYQQGAKQ
jgi:hypothetical protein